jgi:hypothetical protein
MPKRKVSEMSESELKEFVEHLNARVLICTRL